MGRDHTIFALQSGYVKYYRNPTLHPKRQYIGVTFKKNDSLPYPTNAARKRRLGMKLVPRKEFESSSDVLEQDSGVAATASGLAPDTRGPTKNEIKEAKRRQATGRIPAEELSMRPDYSYRESNWQIGRAAERAGVQVKAFRKGDRFLAWRKRSARNVRIAVKKAMGRKTNKKAKSKKGGPRAKA